MSLLLDIRSALAQRVADHIQDNISWENTSFEPPEGLIWYRFRFMPETVDQAEMGRYGMDERSGMVQMDVFGPKGKGIKPVLEKAEKIESYLPRGTALEYNGAKVRVYKTEVESPVPEDDYYHIPVVINWRTFTSPVGE